MNEIYLTRELKEYYFSDYFKNVLTETDPDWKLHESIEPLLTQLMSLEYIQPIYSKFPNEGQQESHIELAYYEHIELPLYRYFLPNILEKFNEQANSKCYYKFMFPRDNNNKNKKGLKMKCMNDPDYFRINCIKIYLEDVYTPTHLEFWNLIVNELKELALYLDNKSIFQGKQPF